jgi:hypothetical protein
MSAIHLVVHLFYVNIEQRSTVAFLKHSCVFVNAPVRNVAFKFSSWGCCSFGPSLFARLISHQPAVLFSQNESATSNQPQPANSTLLSEQTSISHQPPANQTGG